MDAGGAIDSALNSIVRIFLQYYNAIDLLEAFIAPTTPTGALFE